MKFAIPREAFQPCSVSTATPPLVLQIQCEAGKQAVRGHSASYCVAATDISVDLYDRCLFHSYCVSLIQQLIVKLGRYCESLAVSRQELLGSPSDDWPMKELTRHFT